MKETLEDMGENTKSILCIIYNFLELKNTFKVFQDIEMSNMKLKVFVS